MKDAWNVIVNCMMVPVKCYMPRIRRGVRGSVLPEKRQDGSLDAGLICDVDGPWVRYMRLLQWLRRRRRN